MTDAERHAQLRNAFDRLILWGGGAWGHARDMVQYPATGWGGSRHVRTRRAEVRNCCRRRIETARADAYWTTW